MRIIKKDFTEDPPSSTIEYRVLPGTSGEMETVDQSSKKGQERKEKDEMLQSYYQMKKSFHNK